MINKKITYDLSIILFIMLSIRGSMNISKTNYKFKKIFEVYQDEVYSFA